MSYCPSFNKPLLVFDSILDALATLVKVFEEVRLLFVLDFIVIGETFVASVDTLTNRHDLVEEYTAPDITILHVIHAISGACNEAVNLPRVSHLVMLAPISG